MFHDEAIITCLKYYGNSCSCSCSKPSDDEFNLHVHTNLTISDAKSYLAGATEALEPAIPQWLEQS